MFIVSRDLCPTYHLAPNLLNDEACSDIHLITPPESASALEAALARDRHLTSLISHKIEIIAPKELTLTVGTAEIFRLPEVNAAIKGDFLILPCDLVCELEGTLLLREWMVQQTGWNSLKKGNLKSGLSVWYDAKGADNIKEDESDFIITSTLSKAIVPPSINSLKANIHKLVYSLPSDALKEQLSGEDLRLRQSLFQRHAKLNIYSTYRDTHIYFFPYWTLALMKNDKFDSISEDILSWWAKASWQKGLHKKLAIGDIFKKTPSSSDDFASLKNQDIKLTSNSEFDIAALSSTYDGSSENLLAFSDDASQRLASRVNSQIDMLLSPAQNLSESVLPPLLAYVQPPGPLTPLIRRVDNAQRLLSVSLRLAKLPARSDSGGERISPFAHEAKIMNPNSIPQRCTVQSSDTLLAEMVDVEEKVNIKESVVGPGCRIGEGARLLRCLLMEGAVVGANCQLTGCVLGRRCKIEGGPAKESSKTNLKNCEVQDGFTIEWGSKLSYFIAFSWTQSNTSKADARDEKYMSFEGLAEDLNVGRESSP